MPLTNAIKVPITRAAIESSGKAITSNVVAFGVLAGLTGIVSRDAIAKAILARAPKGTEEMNYKALERGFAEAEALLTVKQKA